MKKLIIAIIILGTAFATMAGKPEPKQKSSTREVISASIEYPGFAIEEGLQATVSLLVQIQPNGHIQVLQARSCCEKLLQYTVGRLNSMVLSPEQIDSDQPFTLKVSYQLL
jgi:hypothetical protein